MSIHVECRNDIMMTDLLIL